MTDFWVWARRGYRWVLESAAELALLLALGLWWLLRMAAAALLFPPWVLYKAFAWLFGRRKGGGGL